MKLATNKPAAQRNAADPAPERAQPPAKTRRPQLMARERSDKVPPATAVPSTRLPSKIDQVLALLGRTEGATLADIVAATTWLPHTTRAALTGLRKKGHVLIKDKRDDVTCYRIAEAG